MMGPGAGRADERALPRATVVRLLVVLATASGLLDVFCVTQLGGLFASVITGNLVQLGHGVATTTAHLVTGGVVAVGGFAVGVAVGTLPLRRARPGWHRRTGMVVAAQSLLLVAVAAAWWESNGTPGPAESLALLGGASAASGIQSAVTLSVGLHGASTTYLTGTLTQVMRGLVLDPHHLTAHAGGVSRLLGVFAGAVLGGLVSWTAPRWTPALVVVLVAAVAVTADLVLRRVPASG
ncbi:YoaK family protein [Micromonospora sp. NPDC049366]|uniref:YoaK family protein n=1 Tax=Micromonospora sp. NPDC049366 TaxID=3364271 RepID=UPI00378F4CA9